MTTDFKTGKVTNVLVLKSTGSDPLDREAIFVLRQWRFKPRTGRQADIPITVSRGRHSFLASRYEALGICLDESCSHDLKKRRHSAYIHIRSYQT
jgi:hypothetical protein